MNRDPEAGARLEALLRADLDGAITATDRGTWTTTCSLPHEIRIESSSGVDFVRVSAGAVIGARLTRALLETMNEHNVERALLKTVWMDRKVLLVAEQPLDSLRPGDIENLVSAVFCCTRLDAPLLAAHGGRPTTSPPPALAPDPLREIHSWPELLEVSGTATARELAVWIDEQTGSDCWIDTSDLDTGVVVVIDGTGTGLDWPFTLTTLLGDVKDLMSSIEEEEDDDEDDEDAEDDD